MPLFLIAFLVGDLCLQLFSHLPENNLLYLLLMGVFSSYFFLKKKSGLFCFIIAFTLGFIWTAWSAASILSWSLPKEWEGKPVLITGYVASLPIIENHTARFIFSLQQIKYEKSISSEPTSIQLTWPNANHTLKVGDKRQFLVRLKRIRSLQSPGAIDFEAWALQKKLRAKGMVLKSPDNILLSHDWYHYPIDQLRQQLQLKIQSHLPKTTTAPWLTALIIGERNGIQPEDWQVLRNTGTNHLMAIAGLHIGMMAWLAHGLVSRLWRFFPSLILYLPTQQAGALAALCIALLYSGLAGFSIPTERASIMLAIFILALLTKRQIGAWYAWSLALLCVLVIDPLSVLGESLWLSFGTIALIIYGMSGRLKPSGWWWKWGRVQWVIGIGLTPFTLFFFQQSSLVSFLANSIAIPWLSFLILPFCLLSAVFLLIFPEIGAWLLFIADKSLAGLWVILTWLSEWKFSSWYQPVPNFTLFTLALIGTFLILLPRGFAGRWLGIIWLMPLVFYQPARPDVGELSLSLLDVGQGLSVVVQTKTHSLLYDAGPSLEGTQNTGESIILPFLRLQQIKKIDTLIISHGDNDHLGGARSIIKALPVSAIFSSTPEKLPRTTKLCLAGHKWEWDGIKFSFLYPEPRDLHFGNDSSCVLQIDNGQYRILLTGDIEKYAEKNLLQRMPEQLAANILIAPHHGSKTSSTWAFVKAVHPQLVLYSTGYKNRYRLPHPLTVSVYTNLGAAQLNTAETGTMQFQIKKGSLTRIDLYRTHHKRYWMDA